jgi:hypothetical protein
MSGFEYLVALVSVVAGIGLTRALSGLAKVVHLRHEVRFSDVHLAWTASLLLWLVGYWWFTFLLASVEGWTIPLFVFVLIYGALIYFLIALLYPDELRSDVNLFEHFTASRKWFFGTFICLGVMEFADTWIKSQHGIGTPPMVLYSVFIAVWFLTGILGFTTANLNYHRAIAYSWLVVVFSFMTIFVSSTLIGGN